MDCGNIIEKCNLLEDEDEGLEPTKEWVKDLVDQIITEEFASPDLELVWLAEDDNDLGKNEAALENRVKLGALTLNELRDALGLDPYTNPVADRPMVLTATGYVPIEAGVNGPTADRPAQAANAARMSDLSAEASKGGKGEAKFRNRLAAYSDLAKDYSPDQPRVPAGSSDGGQWTSEGGNGIAGTTSPTPATRSQQYANALVIKHPGAWTEDPRIDETTDKLVTVLEGVTDAIQYPPSMSPQRYGQLVHQAFATAVIAEGLPGIGPNDVETTFPDGPYGTPGSIRTDVVLRDDDGNIIAIYDVKTGEADLTPARANQLRVKTGASSGTWVIQVRFNEALSKDR